jgi:type VI secretion system ImpA family protein
VSSPPVLDIDALVLPVPGADPAGRPLPDSSRLELDELRKEPDPLDPATAGRNPDWGKLVRAASNVLTTKSKDLLAAARLVEAATKKDGIPGLRDGLRLLHRLTTECWDRVHPMPEDGEGYDVREGPVKWLNDVSRGAKFPHVVMELELVRVGNQGFSYLDWLRPARKAELEEVITKADPAALRRVYDDLGEALKALQDLAAALDEKLGADVAPDFLTPENETNLGTALARCVELVEVVARRRGAPLTDTPAASAEANGATPVSDVPATAAPVSVAATRDGLYRQLGQIAATLKGIEPHSPIPFLLDRCVRLGALPFPDLMRAIIRENGALDELDRLLGVEKKAE